MLKKFVPPKKGLEEKGKKKGGFTFLPNPSFRPPSLFGPIPLPFSHTSLKPFKIIGSFLKNPLNPK